MDNHIVYFQLSQIYSLAAKRLRGSWSEPAIQSAPIRWGLVAAFALRRMRNARVQATVFPVKVHRASLGPTKANPLRLILGLIAH